MNLFWIFFVFLFIFSFLLRSENHIFEYLINRESKITHTHKWLTAIYTRTHTHSHNVTQCHTMSHTVTNSHTVTHSHTHTHTLSHTVTHSQTQSHTVTHTYTHSHTLTHTHTLSHTVTHCHTQSHTVTHSHSHTPSHTHSHTSKLAQIFFIYFCELTHFSPRQFHTHDRQKQNITFKDMKTFSKKHPHETYSEYQNYKIILKLQIFKITKSNHKIHTKQRKTYVTVLTKRKRKKNCTRNFLSIQLEQFL